MIYMSYDMLPYDVLFGGCIDTAAHFGRQVPKTPVLGA